jgi:hypothetical protein
LDPIAPPARADDDLAGAARCAVHPDVPAALTCPYCGSYACPDCTFTTSWGERLCAACETAGRSAAVIPWDDGRGLFRTAWAAVRTPKTFFGRFPLGPSRSLARPFALALSASIAVSVVLFVGLAVKTTEHLMGPDSHAERIRERGVVVLLVAFGPVVGIGVGLFSGASMGFLARLGAKQLRFRAALRAGLYLGSAAFLAVPLVVLSNLIDSLPYSVLLDAVSRSLALVVFVGQLIWNVNALHWLARRGGSSPIGAWGLAFASSVAGLVAAMTTYFIAAFIYITVVLTAFNVGP